jgi:hypothetical protein
MDPFHGHPLGSGHWWNQGYWHLLEAIRRAMPAAAQKLLEHGFKDQNYLQMQRILPAGTFPPSERQVQTD